jgi:hypothetical protein
MSKADSPEEWTEMHVNTMAYDVKLDSNLFTLANLRNPRN